MPSALDNPIWGALDGPHRRFALTHGLARRYPPAMARFAALAKPSRESFDDLRALVGPGDVVGLFTAVPLEPAADWQVVRTRPIEQMVLTAPPADAERPTLTLGPDDVPEMLALAELTQPGPFFADTVALGRYIGIRAENGALVAMAGERLRLDGAVEISAVCTHPDHLRRGHARVLVDALGHAIVADGRQAFLHVKNENGAKRLYERLGYRVRREMHLTVLTR